MRSQRMSSPSHLEPLTCSGMCSVLAFAIPVFECFTPCHRPYRVCRRRYAAWAVDLRMSEQCMEAIDEQDHVWKNGIEKVRKGDRKARNDQSATETELLHKVKTAREPNFAKLSKAFEKRTKKRVKGYKFDATKPEAAEFMNLFEQMKAAHAKWFGEKEDLLTKRHGRILQLLDQFYRCAVASYTLQLLAALRRRVAVAARAGR